MSDRELTPKQERFLDALFNEAAGDVRLAMTIAGYAETSSATALVRALREEILDHTNQLLAATAPKAAMSLQNVLNGEVAFGARDVIATAKEVLDRTGLVKVERIDHRIEAPNGIFILPPKNTEGQ